MNRVGRERVPAHFCCSMALDHADLTAVLYFQGYRANEFAR